MFKPVVPNINFPELEKKILDFWYSSGVVEKYLHKNDKAKTRFSFLDGPITANNPMGVHHAWGRTFKDLWQRFYNLRGRKQRFQNGFDCQGLWVEVEVEKELGIKNKKEIENLVPGDKKASIAKFVDLCKERVWKFSKIQTEQSKRLGFFMNWDNSYYTMSDENNYMIWYFLKKCWQNGWVYKGRDSVPWCPRCETAISQHEMLTEDYQELTHESVTLKYPVEGRKHEFLLVWTTTPWTIPANIAIAVDEKLDYSLVKGISNDLFWVAQNLIEKVFKGKYKRIIKTVKGRELVDLKYRGAFDHLEAVKRAAFRAPSKFHTVIATDPQIMPVSIEEGTGLVHTAVSAGEEDFKLGRKYGLPMIPVIADNAAYLPGLGEFSGKNAKNNPRLILDYLVTREKAKKDCLFEIFPYTHRYPACWRCKTELVWKVTDEWYIAMDRPSRKASDGKQSSKTLRERMVEVAKKIRWIPEFGLERELDWLKNMHDWLISKKNRYWGLALPIYECQKCGWFDVVGSKKELAGRAVRGWVKFKDHSPHKPWIDEVKVRCSKCGQETSRIDEVGNPWLDAGIVSFSTLIDPHSRLVSYTTDKKYWREWFPADFITESFPGQFKNWFYSLIAMSTVLENTNPFKTVLGFATLLGENGRPMHKSWGNAIEFNDGADRIGVDVMRWVYVTQNPTENLLFGYKKTDETRRKFQLLLWNIYNFFVTYANVDRWEPIKSQKSKVKSQKYHLKLKNILDKWIMSKLNQLIKTVTESLERYDAFTASHAIEEFVEELSTWYVRRSRDRVGPTAQNKDDKNACYTTLFEVLLTLSKLLTPFTPFLSEEIYRNLTREESVHLSDWPKISQKSSRFNRDKSQKLLREMNFVRKVCELGHAERKKNGVKVKQPLKKLQIANCKLQIESDLRKLVKDELNVKEVEVVSGEGELLVKLEIKLTPELIAEGKARDLVRQIQLKRKEIRCNLTDKVRVILPTWPGHFTDYIKKETLASTISKGDSFSVERV